MDNQIDTNRDDISAEEYLEILRQDLLMDTEEFDITPQKVRRILAANLEE